MANYVCYLFKKSHFVASRFTNARKEEILQGFRSGKPLSTLSEEFSCTPATVTRILRSLLSDDEFVQLKKANKKNQKSQPIKQLEKIDLTQDLSNEFKDDAISSDDSFADEFSDEIVEETSSDEVLDESEKKNTEGIDQFHELIPLITNLEWDKQNEVACKPFSSDLLPETVFMLVDKTVELDSKPLKEFSQWSFLPDSDQNRLVIVLYSNQRSAKRSCSRNQRVIKVPDSSVFQITLQHLISKGITRLILDENLIAIDK